MSLNHPVWIPPPTLPPPSSPCSFPREGDRSQRRAGGTGEEEEEDDEGAGGRSTPGDRARL